MRLRLAALSLIAGLLAAPSGFRAAALESAPDASPSALCEAAIERAARAHGVPRRLLSAVALVESGRTRDGARRPWPWTVNVEGEGRWFEDRRGALAFVAKRRAAGAKSFDVGCMQLNHYWHGKHFDGVEQMFDPDANLDYAARYLKQLMAETGDWMRAAGYYHSRTPEHFQRYSALIADAYEASKSAPRPAAELRLAATDAPRPTPRRPLDPPRAVEDAPGWSGLLRLAQAPARGAGAAGLALFSRSQARQTRPPAEPERRARSGARSGGVALTGLGGGGQPMLRTGRPFF